MIWRPKKISIIRDRLDNFIKMVSFFFQSPNNIFHFFSVPPICKFVNKKQLKI
nr:MAG TPA: hypothetical protein [Caudoviricetes sp.]